MADYTLLGSPENILYCKKNAIKLLDFGRNFPPSEGGSYYLGGDGNPLKDRPRETWITARMLHVYSIGSMADIEGCKCLAEKAFHGLRSELCDRENGGWYAGINVDGSVLPGKQCYAHAFVILSGCSAYLAGIDGAEEFVEKALKVYDRFFWDEKNGMSCDLWDTTFKVLDEYRGLNANMHTVEAFLAAYDVLDRKEYLMRAGRIIEHTLGWAEEFSDYRLPEHYSNDWKPLPDLNKEKPDDPFKPYGATPGHGMEWARLITQFALSMWGYEEKDGVIVPSKQAIPYIERAEKLYERAYADAWNADGAKGFVYTTDWDGKPVVHDRMHWTLAEAINTSAVLYNVTGRLRYREDYAEYLSYLEESVLDSSCGSWFHQLDEKNRLKETVWPGKPDIYHAFQSMIIPHVSPDKSVAVEGGKFLSQIIV